MNKRQLAVITGASSGFGKEFARQLAAKEYDLLITARNEKKLNEVKQELEARYGVGVEVFVCDLADAAALKTLEDRLEGEERLEVLVNNAGFGATASFPDVDTEQEEAMIRVHCIATMRLARAALIPMRRNKKGYIINLASIAAWIHGPNSADYAATKAYVLSFSRALQCDVRQYGIRVQALCPGLAHTNFHFTESVKKFDKNTTPRFLWLTAEYVVRTSLRGIAEPRRFKAVCVPSLRYKLILALLRLPFSGWIMERVYKKYR